MDWNREQRIQAEKRFTGIMKRRRREDAPPPCSVFLFRFMFSRLRFFTSFPVTNGLLTNENSQQQAPRKRTICAALVRTFSALLIQNSKNVWFSWRFGSVWPGSAVCMCGNSASCHRQLAQRLLRHRWFYVF